MNSRMKIRRRGTSQYYLFHFVSVQLFICFLYFVVRVNSVKNLSTIATALGKERTRNELLPYIMDLMDDDEEILIELSLTLNG